MSCQHDSFDIVSDPTVRVTGPKSISAIGEGYCPDCAQTLELFYELHTGASPVKRGYGLSDGDVLTVSDDGEKASITTGGASPYGGKFEFRLDYVGAK